MKENVSKDKTFAVQKEIVIMTDASTHGWGPIYNISESNVPGMGQTNNDLIFQRAQSCPIGPLETQGLN